MALIHVDAPRCLGNCRQGRKPCTWPGVCSARPAPRTGKVSERDLDERQLERLCVAETAANIAAEQLTGKPAGASWLSARESVALWVTVLAPVAAVSLLAIIVSVAAGQP